jgi:exosome complex exonuclease RRP6
MTRPTPTTTAPVVVDTLQVAKRPTVVDLNSVKSDSSSFWGTTLGGSAQQRQMSSDVRLSLPMPEVNHEVFAMNGTTPAKVDAPIVASPTLAETESPAQSAPQAENNDVFILREKGKRGRKRKVDDVQDELQNGLDEVNDADVGDAAAHRKQRDADKARRKEEKRKTKVERQNHAAQQPAVAANNADGFMTALTGPSSPPGSTPKKKAKKSKKQNPTNATGFMAALLGSSSTGAAAAAAAKEGEREAEAEAEEPFDYANAPSVLNAAPADTGKKKKGKKGRMAGFDPYKKALNTGKGVPRGQKERAGMAKTFKS